MLVECLLASKYLRETAIPAPAPALDLETAARLRELIGRISRRLRPTAAGRAAGLTPTGRTVLLHVVRGERVRLSEIAGAEGLNPTMLSRVVAGLAEAGLVSRASDEDDRRAAWVAPTAAGKRLAERMRRERTDALIVALEALDEADRRAIEQALPALEQVSERLKGRRP